MQQFDWRQDADHARDLLSKFPKIEGKTPPTPEQVQDFVKHVSDEYGTAAVLDLLVKFLRRTAMFRKGTSRYYGLDKATGAFFSTRETFVMFLEDPVGWGLAQTKPVKIDPKVVFDLQLHVKPNPAGGYFPFCARVHILEDALICPVDVQVAPPTTGRPTFNLIQPAGNVTLMKDGPLPDNSGFAHDVAFTHGELKPPTGQGYRLSRRQVAEHIVDTVMDPWMKLSVVAAKTTKVQEGQWDQSAPTDIANAKGITFPGTSVYSSSPITNVVAQLSYDYSYGCDTTESMLKDSTIKPTNVKADLNAGPNYIKQWL